MNRLSRDAERLADELASACGVSPETAVIVALEEALAQRAPNAPARSASQRAEFIRRLEEKSRRAGALPVRDPRSADEILGYDQYGISS